MVRKTVCRGILVTICLLLMCSGLGSAQSDKQRHQDPRGVTVVPAALPPSSPAYRVALVIGNAMYRNVRPLRNPVHDATAIATILEQLGFKVVLLQNAERRAMLKAIAELGTKLSQGGVGLFYYAGHGVQVKGENYLVPVEAPLDSDTLADDMVPVQRVIERMEDAKNGLNILILDACRDNPFVSNTRGGQRGLAAMEAPLGTLVAFAASRNQLASDGEGPHGLYTSYLLKYLRTPGLPVEQLFKQVRNSVSTATGGKQVPEEWTKLQGDFAFVPSEQHAPPVLPVPTSQVPGPSPPPRPASGFPVAGGSYPQQPQRSEQGTDSSQAGLALSSIRGRDRKEMLLVSAGLFAMGSQQGNNEERPVHQVMVDTFYMDKYEVTIGEYMTFLQATGHRALPSWVSMYAPRENHPVIGVSWEDARAYCQWAEKQLPTESQWEKAARGVDGRAYPWGHQNADRSRANAADPKDGYQYTAPVGSFTDGASPYGIHDLAGNVWEWVHDAYDPAYYQRSPERNPVNDQASLYHVIRGGGWHDAPADLRMTLRGKKTRDDQAAGVGFRCVQSGRAPER